LEKSEMSDAKTLSWLSLL